MIRKNKGGRLENVIASVGIVITVCIAIFGYYIRTPYLYGQTSDGFLVVFDTSTGSLAYFDEATLTDVAPAVKKELGITDAPAAAPAAK